jgi:hypothetical protein
MNRMYDGIFFGTFFGISLSALIIGILTKIYKPFKPGANKVGDDGLNSYLPNALLVYGGFFTLYFGFMIYTALKK